MRVLLRRTSNGFYYQNSGAWVSNPQKGFNFGSIHRAMEFAEKTDSDQMELALAFDNSSLISAVSIKAVQAELAHSGSSGTC
jgi:hypothetical protein